MLFNVCMVLLFWNFVYAQDYKICENCVPLTNCTRAVNSLSKEKNEDQLVKLRDSHCGFIGYIPMICCMEFEKVPVTTPTPPTTTQAQQHDEQFNLEAMELDNKRNSSVSNEFEHPNLSLLPDVCGDVNGDRIVGGITAGLYEFPWMALLSYKDVDSSLQFKCAGSIINSRYVLTAAHCLISSIVGVRVGEYDIRTKYDCQGEQEFMECISHIQDIRIEKLIRHPKYRRRPYVFNDIGLIRLAVPADFNFRNVAPICLPTTNDLINNGLKDRAVVAGWGVTETGQQSPVLLKVDVPVATPEECAQTHHGKAEYVENKICAGELNRKLCQSALVERMGGGDEVEVKNNTNTTSSDQGSTKDSSQGDSGGPLMAVSRYKNVGRYILYGIVSYGRRDCGVAKYPGYYTDVSKFMDWILSNMEP